MTPKDYHNDVKPNLLTAITGMQVLAINSDNKGDELKYSRKTEKKYIAIGGNKLSRGFTLEGLTINYFIRNTDFADTLLQMGRWFGYRPGYLDCCKLFTTASSINKFNSVSLTVEELEETFAEINKKGGKPSDFEIRVKDNPRVIKLTRGSILRNTENIRVSYSMGIEQSTKFLLNKLAIEAAWEGFVNHVKNLDWQENIHKDVFFHKTDTAGLFKFLELENNFYDFDLLGVREYIDLCNRNGKLLQWTVGIRKNSGSKAAASLAGIDSGLPGTVNLTTRSGPRKSAIGRFDFVENNIFKVSDKSAQIVTVGSDFALTLTNEEIQEVKQKFNDRRAATGNKGSTSIPDKDYRSIMGENQGILMIYLLDTAKVFESTDGKEPVLEKKATELGINKHIPMFGFALGFPEIKGDLGGEYVRVKKPEIIEETEVEEFPEELIDHL